MDYILWDDLEFLGELYEYGGESVQNGISKYVTPTIRRKIREDPFYLANFSPSQVKPAK